jgi:hypothetical protein
LEPEDSLRPLVPFERTVLVLLHLNLPKTNYFLAIRLNVAITVFCDATPTILVRNVSEELAASIFRVGDESSRFL